MKQRIDNLVEKALCDFPHTRDSDTDLQIKVIELGEWIVITDTVPVFLLKHYKAETVRRNRQRIQNTYHNYEATDKVRIARIKKKHNILTWLFG